MCAHLRPTRWRLCRILRRRKPCTPTKQEPQGSGRFRSKTKRFGAHCPSRCGNVVEAFGASCWQALSGQPGGRSRRRRQVFGDRQPATNIIPLMTGWPSPDRGRQKYSTSGPETLHRDNPCGGNNGWEAPFPLSFYLDGDPSLLAPVLPTLLGQRSKLLSAERPKSSHATMHVHMKWHDHETDSGQPGYQRQNRRVPSP